MKIISEKLCHFRDLSRTRIPISMLKNAQHDDFKIILSIEFFTSDMPQQYTIFYAEEETARDDFAKILRLFKKLKGK